MIEVGRVEMDCGQVRSLAWVGTDLVDIASRWRTLPLDGTRPEADGSVFEAGFNAVAVSPLGDLVALVASTGTKGLILDSASHGIVREINRSEYHAEAYRYPITFFTLPDGRTGLVHCPTAHNRLEIEDARTGAPIHGRGERDPVDFFHSRLAVSADGTRLLSAGWVWQPYGCLAVYDLSAALGDPARLDSASGDVYGLKGLVQAEVGCPSPRHQPSEHTGGCVNSERLSGLRP